MKNQNGGAGRVRTMSIGAAALSVSGLVVALIAAGGSSSDTWSFGTGFLILRYAFYAAVAGGALALLALISGRRHTGASAMTSFAALAISLLFGAYLLNQVASAKRAPAIHDVATNVDDLPQFAKLIVRPDNLENIPDMGRAELKAMAPKERWQEIHREAYGDLSALKVETDVATTLRRAEALARARGWEVAAADPEAGTLEATATTRFFGFKDDIAVRVRPDPSRHGGSVVDMRSISRVGGSDIGVNAARIRAFLADLSGKASS